jgi:hypothetical protein
VRRFLRHNGLSLAFGALFALALGFQALAGWHEFNNDEVAHAQLAHEQPREISFGRYLTSSHFGRAVTENWQSEYLQFSLFILATIWLVQRGSPESKPLDRAGPESDQRQQVGRPCRLSLPALGPRRRPAHLRLFELAADRDAGDLPRILVRPVGDRLDRVQRRAGRP